MPAPQTTQASPYLSFFDIHGRNGYDDPFTLPEDQCCEAKNTDWYGAALGRRRGGSSNFSIAGGTAFGSGVRFITRHVPGVDQTAAEGWGVDGVGLVKRLAAGTAWANVTLADAILDNFGEVNAVSFNGKLFFGYHSGQNRLHAWDGSTIRRVGIAVAAPPTAANLAGGFATIRWYKVRWIRQVAGVTVDVGELSSSISITPGLGGARITQPTPPGESETHWEVFASPTDSNYFSFVVVAKATTTTDDVGNPATEYTGAAAPVTGSHLPPPSAKYLVTDDGRIIMAGCWETTGGEVTASNTRIWWTSQLGSSNQGDDERINISTTISSFDDVEEAVTGLSKPIQGAFFAFSYDSQWKFVATGDVISPYQRFRVAGGQGCISHKSIIVASDDAGYPATYWLSSRGIERAGRSGNQYCGYDVGDIFTGTSTAAARINLDATTLPFAIYHKDIHQIWWYVAVDGSVTPNLRLVFDTALGKVVDVFRQGAVRGGWAIHDGEAAKAYCGTMLSNTVGASMSRLLKPYIGYTTTTQVWKCDTSDPDDVGTGFQSYVESRPLAPWGLGRQGGMTQEPVLIGVVSKTSSIQLKVIVDEYAEVLTSKASLAAVSDSLAETRVFVQFEDAKVASANSIRFRVGDPDVVSAPQWILTALISPVEAQGDR